MYKYHFNSLDLDAYYFDRFKKQSYKLKTHGNTLKELIENSKIFVFDKKGNEILSEDIEMFEEEVISYVETLLKKEIKKLNNLQLH